MVVLVYRAETVGPVCRRVAQAAPEAIKFVRDSETIPPGLRVRWGSVVAFEGRALNTANAVAIAKNHSLSRQLLSNLAPPTWFQRQDIPRGMPVVIRPRAHHAGRRFHVCRSVREIDRAIRRCGVGWYASLLVAKAREFRVFVCQGFVVAVSERFPANATDVAWNLAMGGRLINLPKEEWPVPVVKTSILAADKLGLDWCAIDACIDTGGDCFVFEANTAPGLRNPFTISQIAKVFVWADTHDTPERTDGKTWRKLIHPALRHKLR